MSVITSYKEHLDLLFEYTDASEEILITTGNVYAGITYYGSDTIIDKSNSIRKWLDYLDSNSGKGSPDVKILAAIPYYKSCKNHMYCEDCATEYVKLLLKMLNHALFFSNIKWYMCEHIYLKAMCFNTGSSWSNIVTTRNLTDMDQNQCSINMPIVGEKIALKIKEDFAKAVPLEERYLEEALSKTGIKEQTVRSLVNG